MKHIVEARGLLVVLVLFLAFATGCSLPGSDQEQALEEQRQKNEELQKQLEEQQEKEEEARQRELEQQVEDLQEQVEEQEQDQQDQDSVSSEGGSSEVSSGDDIQNSSTTPSQAAEGIVVVSPDFDTNAATTEEAAVINAAIEYYEYAEIGDYYTTYNLLSYEDQDYYTEAQWVEANTALDSAAGEFVVTGAYPDDLGLGVPTYAVTLTVYGDDGSSFNRTTYFINEGGYWAHYLSGEEVDMFDGALY